MKNYLKMLRMYYFNSNNLKIMLSFSSCVWEHDSITLYSNWKNSQEAFKAKCIKGTDPAKLNMSIQPNMQLFENFLLSLFRVLVLVVSNIPHFLISNGTLETKCWKIQNIFIIMELQLLKRNVLQLWNSWRYLCCS